MKKVFKLLNPNSKMAKKLQGRDNNEVIDFEEEKKSIILSPEEVNEIETLVDSYLSIEKLYNYYILSESNIYDKMKMSFRHTISKLSELSQKEKNPIELGKILKVMSDAAKSMKMVEKTSEDKEANKINLSELSTHELREHLKKSK